MASSKTPQPIKEIIKLSDEASWYCAIAIIVLILLASIKEGSLADEPVRGAGLLNRPCDEIYIVGEGETLHTISDKCGDPFIVEQNPHIHDPDDVYPGLVIKITTPTEPRKLLRPFEPSLLQVSGIIRLGSTIESASGTQFGYIPVRRLAEYFRRMTKSAPYSFVHHAILAPPVSSYDYIIIGGGTAGCALAATLSEKSNVLLLERGGSPLDHPTVNFAATFGATLADVSPHSASQPFVSTDGVINARARVLGGGSALNAGFYSRASPSYVSQAGWDQKLVNESYEWVEKKVVFRPPMPEFQSAVKAGLLEIGVLPDNGFTFEHLYGTKVGGTIFDQTGRRHTAAELLEYADPTKITVYLYATVHDILFSKVGEKSPRAVGVEFRDSKGIIHKAIFNKGPLNEVILSAGALGSPQMLLLSGIGPKAHLTALGIKVELDQPMVGQEMSDNPTNGLVIPLPRPVEISLVQVDGITRSDSFVQAASFSLFGWLRPNKLVDFIRVLTNQTGQNSTDMFYQSLNTALQGGSIIEKVAGPISTGHLMLKTRSPYHNPIVTFNYFKEPEDLQRCVEGMRTIIRVVESKAFSSFRHPLIPLQTLIDAMLKLPINLRPRRASAAFDLEKFCVDTVMTIWHYHGGCVVGKVVDKDYRVMGVDGLRVIDGSTFRYSPGTNPQATVMMLGRYMGQKILKERFPDGMN